MLQWVSSDEYPNTKIPCSKCTDVFLADKEKVVIWVRLCKMPKPFDTIFDKSDGRDGLGYPILQLFVEMNP